MPVIGTLRRRKLYAVWHGMNYRCYEPTCRAYHNYGGRGITVCRAWREFEPFYRWAVVGWKPGLMIDRVNNNSGYRPSNCRWADRETQNWNKRNTYPDDKKSSKMRP